MASSGQVVRQSVVFALETVDESFSDDIGTRGAGVCMVVREECGVDVCVAQVLEGNRYELQYSHLLDLVIYPSTEEDPGEMLPRNGQSRWRPARYSSQQHT